MRGTGAGAGAGVGAGDGGDGVLGAGTFAVHCRAKKTHKHEIMYYKLPFFPSL